MVVSTIIVTGVIFYEAYRFYDYKKIVASQVCQDMGLEWSEEINKCLDPEDNSIIF